MRGKNLAAYGTRPFKTDMIYTGEKIEFEKIRSDLQNAIGSLKDIYWTIGVASKSIAQGGYFEQEVEDAQSIMGELVPDAMIELLHQNKQAILDNYNNAQIMSIVARPLHEPYIPELALRYYQPGVRGPANFPISPFETVTLTSILSSMEQVEGTRDMSRDYWIRETARKHWDIVTTHVLLRILIKRAINKVKQRIYAPNGSFVKQAAISYAGNFARDAD